MSEAVKPLTVPRELLGPPGDFNPTLLMFLAAIVLATVSTVAYFCWHWYSWCSFVMNLLALHLVGTVIHDACHNAAHPNRIVNAILGHGSAQMLCFSFPVFTRVHMQHHANVNDPQNDPDHVVSTMGPLWLINARFFYHEIYFFQRQLWRKYELLEWVIARSILATIVFLGYQYGFIGYIFNFWFVPLAIVGWELGLFFDYLPHRPFQERDRWKNARVYPSRILNLMIMGQNYHLVHHLWPSIPWYNYERAYFATKPLLDAKGSHQSLGLLQTTKDFFGFVYDIILGIHFHKKETAEVVKPGEATPQVLDLEER
ncbi:fatty acid desaturase [Leptothermofonsia sichuanensis E412]|uniref:beta-carotene hydroxylase n=1 Tax=Leptothermofonsia sichuanensis TaxID=2917832 RepID=UPI001CA6E146|nr:fatty acid desaturase [Leptothermofonsia sichuanensis]QZZ18587.1 fatty acid desaturase [Leptothermofonsia sichuanensis E412]